jgi:hypothetical protein
VSQSIRINSDRSAAVDHSYNWRPIDKHTPRGVKLQLINRTAGVAIYGQIQTTETFFTHWAPMPKFKD